MFGGQMFGEMLFGGSSGTASPPPEPPNPDPGGGGAAPWTREIRRDDREDTRNEADDVALALSLLL